MLSATNEPRMFVTFFVRVFFDVSRHASDPVPYTSRYAVSATAMLAFFSFDLPRAMLWLLMSIAFLRRAMSVLRCFAQSEKAFGDAAAARVLRARVSMRRYVASAIFLLSARARDVVIYDMSVDGAHMLPRVLLRSAAFRRQRAAHAESPSSAP